MTSSVRVVDLTSRLGSQALLKLGVAYAPGDSRTEIRLSESARSPTIEWGGAPEAQDALQGPGVPPALVMLVGPGSVQQAQDTLKRALAEKVPCIRIFILPSAIIEEITLKGMVARDHEVAYLYRLPDSSSETLWFVLIEEIHKLAARFGLDGQAGDSSHETEAAMSTNLTQSMQQIMSIDGAVAAALVDHRSGMCLAKAGGGMDLELAAGGNTQVVRAKLQTMEALGLRKGIEDILITLGDQYHLIRLVPHSPGLFLYLVLDKERGNLALARYRLTDIERSLKV